MPREIEFPALRPGGPHAHPADIGLTDAPTVACTACSRPIDVYYEVGGAVVCEGCCERIEADLRAKPGLSQALRALILGGGAALVAASGYALSIHLTKRNWFLVSILVGYFIGTAVRKGSGGRGGSFFQALAVLLTYMAIGLTFASLAFAGVGVPMAVLFRPEFLLKFFEFLFQIPILHAKESPIAIAIIGFALWEAWKLNKPLRMEVAGPYWLPDAGEMPAGDDDDF